MRLECWVTANGETGCMECGGERSGSKPVSLEAPRTCAFCRKEIKDPWPLTARLGELGEKRVVDYFGSPPVITHQTIAKRLHEDFRTAEQIMVDKGPIVENDGTSFFLATVNGKKFFLSVTEFRPQQGKA